MSLSDRIQSRNPDPVAPVTREQHAEPERAPAPTDPFADLKSRVHHDVITRLGPRLFAAGGDEGRDASIEPRVLEAVEEAIALDKTPLTRQERAQVTREIADDILGYGPLEPFLRDDTVSEIMVNGPHSIWVERRGKLLRTDAGFVDDQHLLRIIDKIISRIGRRIDEASPMVDARLPDGSRVNAIIPPLAVTGPTLTIRKFRRDPLTMEDLLRFGTLTPRAAQLLEACVRGKLNILISGGTGSGKTTTLNVLSAAIPEGERIVTVEDAAELQLRQEHVITLESRPANIEGKGMVSIRDLVRNCLRMRPDRIIVGECRGPETIDMLQAMNTGHDGSLTTIHANTPRDALSRVETLVLTGGVELPLKAIREQIASAFDMVVQVSRLVDGTRRITHITEVLRMESDVVTLQDLFIAKPVEDGDEVAAGSASRLLGPMQRAAASSRSSSPSSARTACTCRRSSSSSSPSAPRQRAAAPDGVRQGLGMRRGARASSPASRPCSRVAVGASGAATPRVRIAQVDTSRYPLITATVIAPGQRQAARRCRSTLSENGKRRHATQSGGGAPAAIGVAIDVSRSMEGAPLAAAKQAAAVVREGQAHGRLDGALLLRARGEPACTRSTPTSTSLGAVARTRSRSTRVQGTALYDSVIQASQRARRPHPTLTKVLVVLTDGDDTTKTKLGAAVKAAKAAGRHRRRDRDRQRRSHAALTVARPPDRRPRLRGRPLGRRHQRRLHARSPRRSATPTASSTPRTPTASCRSRSASRATPRPRSRST